MERQQIAEDKMKLQLGDIIELNSTTDDSIGNIKYFIKFIDNTRIVLVGEDQSVKELAISEEGNLENEAITGITILSRASDPGYARQNNLVPGTWINVFFDDGDIPIILTGKITNLEEDQIEITTYETNEVIYIDFEYKGLPVDLPIEKIVIREQPMALATADTADTAVVTADTAEQTQAEQTQAEAVSAIIQQALVVNEDEVNIPTDNFKERIRDLFITTDQIQFGESLDDITQIVNVPESEQRFGIEKQTNDLLDEMLSTVPNVQRTRDVLNNIHTMIERFKQLRTEFSEFDQYGNALMPAIQGSNYKPLVKSLEKLNHKLYWILPVTQIKKKLYMDDEDDTDYDRNAIELLSQMETLQNEENIMETYKQNDVPNGQNKYEYMIKNVNSMLTPFIESPNSENALGVVNVGTNITAVISSLDNFNSYVAKVSDSSSKIKTKRFLMQDYNLGENTIESTKKGGKITTKVKNITQPDAISIKSLLTLPESTVVFSHINLPSTDILIKSNLNQNFLAYWRTLNETTALSTVIIDDLKSPIDYDKTTFLSGITEYVSNEDATTMGKYNEYLESVIPKTRTIFNLMKKYITGKLSVYDVLKYMEPFMIYQKDISFKQYQEITEYINEKISEYKKNYAIKEREYGILSYGDFKRQTPALFKILSNNSLLMNKVEELYGLQNLPLSEMSNAELIRRLNKIDNSRLFNTAIAELGKTLMIADGLRQLTNIEEFAKKQETEKPSKQDLDCNKYILAKRYIEIDELEEDNGNEIYFDKQYDKTYYDIVKEYRSELSALVSLKDKILFLKNNLVSKNKVSENMAIRDARAMIVGKRHVIDGDYAVLIIRNQEGASEALYFKRINNVWMRDTTINPATFTDSGKMFCNLTEKCFDIKDNCKSVTSSKNDLKTDNLNQIMNEFDKDLIISQSKINSKITDAINDAFSRVGVLNTIEIENQMKYNNQHYGLSLTAEEIMVQSSPYDKLRDLILGQGDFVKRQTDISRFVAYYTRPSTDAEDKWWLYCTASNVKLLPTFVAKLADAFNNKDNYFMAIQKICAEQGEISDDGDSWVDKYSGYIITAIDFDNEEGYTDAGSKITSRGLIEEDIGDTIVKSGKSSKTYTSKEAETISNIVNAVSKFAGVDIATNLDFIVRNSLNIFNIAIPSKEAYEKAISAAASKGKKAFDSYADVYNRTLILITLSFLLIAIQTSIPSIRSKKTHPGCKKSFSGFPLNGIEDKTGLTYIACIANDIKSSIEPWSAIQKMKQTALATQIEATINKFIISLDEIQVRIQDKLTYVITEEVIEIPKEHDIKNWINFLPPLKPAKQGATIQNVSTEFQKEFINNLRTGSKTQYENINVLRSKIIYFSRGIENRIQKVISNNIKTNTAILKNSANEPFIENACCDNGSINTYEYFTNAEPEIGQYNTVVSNLADLLYDVKRMGTSPFLFDPSDTRRKLTEISPEFSEETIYKAFMVYCKYNSNTPISEELRAICMEKPRTFDKKDTIGEKIRKLKQEGYNFTNASLQNLIGIVNRSNIVKLELHDIKINNIQVLRDIILSMNERNVSSIPLAFREKFLSMLDIPHVNELVEDTPKMREMKNYLAAENTAMRGKLIEFVTANITTNRTKTIQEFNKCLTDLIKFNMTGDGLLIEKEDETMYKMITFIKNSLRALTRVLPNIIVNAIDFSEVNIPRHWKLSGRHEKDVQNIINKFYTPLKQFYNDESVSRLLVQAQYLIKDIEILAQNTVFYTPIKTGNDAYIYSVFDRRLCTLLFEYYFNVVLLEYVKLVDEPEILKLNKEPILGDDAITMEDMATTNAVDEIQNGVISQLDIVMGNKSELSQKVGALINVFTSIACNNKSSINYNYDTLMERIMRAKEKEKDIITDYLKVMTDEEREVENLFKNHKLERWSKGQEKGLRIYQGDTYDEEREAMEKQIITEMKLNKMDKVTEMNRDIYAMDELESQMESEEIEREKYDMSNIAEDNDDYGEVYEDDY